MGTETKKDKETHGTEILDKEMQCKIKSNEMQDAKNPLEFIAYRMMSIYC